MKGDKSIIWEDDVGDYMRDLLNRQVPFIEIPEARHDATLDQPLAFVAALRTLLQEWRYSTRDREVAESLTVRCAANGLAWFRVRTN